MEDDKQGLIKDLLVGQLVQSDVLRAGQPGGVVGGGPMQLPVLDRVGVRLERLALLQERGDGGSVAHDFKSLEHRHS